MTTDTELRELRVEIGRLRLERAELADQNEALRSRIDRFEEHLSFRVAKAVAAITPCSCSAQRARTERAERQLSDVAETGRKLFVECRDLRIRAGWAEAEVQRLRAGIEALTDELHRVDAAMLAGGAGSASMSVRETERRLRSLLQEGE